MRRRAPLRLRWLMAWAALLLSSLSMFSITSLLSRQLGSSARAREAQSLLRLARLDLAEGALRLLARGASSEDRDEGRAQLLEAKEVFREAGEAAAGGLLRVEEIGPLLDGLGDSLDSLALTLSRSSPRAGGASAGASMSDPELWIALRDIERGAGTLDARLASALAAADRDSRQGYLLALWAASLLLAATALALHFAAGAEAKADRALAESRLLLDAIVDMTPSRIYAHDREGRCILANATEASLYGLSEEELLGRERAAYLGRVQAELLAAKEAEVLSTGAARSDEESVEGPEGRRWFLTTRFPLRDREGRIYAVGGISTEVTEGREASERLRRAYAEKAALVEEINHRARNNMQVISSWLQLQAGRSGNPALRAALEDADARVAAMSLVHGMLYRGGDLSYLELRDYLGALVEHLLRRGEGTGGIGIELRLEPVRTSFDHALTCGLVVVELFSNSLRHAFADRTGRIGLRLRRDGEGRIELRYEDDGPGLPPGFSPREQGGLGLAAVIASVEGQLGGRIDFDGGGGGFACTLSFGDDSYRARV